MTRDEVIAILEKHHLPLPISPAEAKSATIACCTAHWSGECVIVLTDNRIVYWRRPGELLSLGSACHSEVLTLLCDYARSLSTNPTVYPGANAALSEFTKAKVAALNTEHEAGERRQLSRLKAKYEEASA